MKKNGFSIKTWLMETLRDERKRKPFLVALLVFVVVFAGLTAYRQATDAQEGDVIVTGGLGASAETQTDMDAKGKGGGDTGDYTDTTEEPDGNGGVEGDGTATGANSGESPAGGSGGEPSAIFVDIGGAVKVSGLFALPAGSRVADAIDAAGGLTDDAYVKYINRATILADGDRLYVPTESEVSEGSAPPTAGQVGGVAGGNSGGPSSGVSQTTDGQGLVNINTAGSEELQSLNGVGPATAQKIIDYRAANGGFGSIEDIMNVSGIGAKTFEKFKARITV